MKEIILMTEMTIEAIVRKASKIMDSSWRAEYEERREELERMFAEFGDRAYGAWIQRFMVPVFAHLAEEGYQAKAGFNRSDSVENWGPPEERERCAWYVIKGSDGEPVGSMILQVYHSHRSFRLPRAPRLFALPETDKEAIVAALSRAGTRVRWDRKEERLAEPVESGIEAPRWEYATDVSLGDCLRPEDDAQLHSWSLDEMLSHWGRYGWELVNVVSRSDGRTIAFFKRPA